jgi:hypothetical protein
MRRHALSGSGTSLTPVQERGLQIEIPRWFPCHRVSNGPDTSVFIECGTAKAIPGFSTRKGAEQFVRAAALNCTVAFIGYDRMASFLANASEHAQQILVDCVLNENMMAKKPMLVIPFSRAHDAILARMRDENFDLGDPIEVECIVDPERPEKGE